MAIRVLGIDSSTKTGVAVMEFTEGGVSKLYDNEIRFPKLKGIERADHIAAGVGEIAAAWGVDHCVIENYGFGNAHTLATLVEIGTMIRYVLLKTGYKYLEVPPTSLKKFVTGKGNVKKDQMALHLYKRFDMEGETDNIVDGIGLALFGGWYYGHGSAIQLPQAHLDALNFDKKR